MDHLLQSPGQLPSHLRALRQARGLSQSQLGALLGVGQTRVARIEQDPGSVSVAQFLGVLSALGVQVVLRAPGDRPPAGDAPPALRSVKSRAWRPASAPRPDPAPGDDDPW